MLATAESRPPAPPLVGPRKIILSLLFAGAILVGAVAGVFVAYESDLPQISSLENYQPNIITEVYSADGSVLGRFAIERRIIVRYGDIPPVLRNAIIAVEDAGFFQHIGIDVQGLLRAGWANFRSGRPREGASTLTMQLSRQLFLTPEKTYERKIKEILLAFEIEKNFTKEEIFTLYCNYFYLGHGNYGVEAASRFFYSKSIKDLTLSEAALIAGLFQSGVRLTPVEYPERALNRRNHVLDRMVNAKYISPAEAAQAKAEPLHLRLHKEPPSIAPYFLEEVRKYLEREYGSQRIYQGGLRVYTTLDPRLQRAANSALQNGLLQMDRSSRGYAPITQSALRDGALPQPLELDEWAWAIAPGNVVRGVILASDRGAATVQIGPYRARLTGRDIAWTGRTSVSEVLPYGAIAPLRIDSLNDESEPKEAHVKLEQEPLLEGALLAVDVRTGAIRAMVGGYDFARSKFNRATQAMRQVGSAFKPIVYAAAIEQAGLTPATILSDSPLSFPDPSGKSPWTPHNYDFTFMGSIPLRRALEQSRNIPAIRTLQHVGIEQGIAYARKLGLSGTLPPYLPIAIGAGEATLMEMTMAFATFANQGLRMKPLYITHITDRDGNIIEENRPQATDAIRADTAYLMTSLLRGVVERGTAQRARALNRPIAGKTGTTDDWTDAWFVGFEPTLAAGVWLGFDEKKRSLGRGHDGAHAALPIWIDFWKSAMGEAPLDDYTVPGNIVFVPVDGTGHLTRPGSPGSRLEAFIAGTEPRAGNAAAGAVASSEP